MSIKEKLENNLIVTIFTVAITAFGFGWGACEKARVESKNERISVLERQTTEQNQIVKDSNVATEPLKRQLATLVTETKRLETELLSSNASLEQWQQALNSWRDANAKLQEDIGRYAANCSIIAEIRGLETKKENLEKTLINAYRISNEKENINDYKRRVLEYQTRLIALQTKLSCEPK